MNGYQHVTFALEKLPNHAPPSVSVPILMLALRDDNPVTREGAVKGLEVVIEEQGVREVLAKVMREDLSQGVREAASEALFE